MPTVGGEEHADRAARDAVDLGRRRRPIHAAEQAELEKTAAGKIQKLPRGQIEVIYFKLARGDMLLQKIA
jgi:hypothetical protein